VQGDGDVARALALCRQGHFSDAEKLLKGVLGSSPGHIGALSLYAMLAVQVRKFDIALEVAGQAIRGSPYVADLHYTLGRAHKAKGDTESAIAAYRRALELDPSQAAVWVSLGIALRNRGSLDEAIACYKRALELKPDLGEARHGLAVVLRDKGDLETAVMHYNLGTASRALRAKALVYRALELREIGRYDEALLCYHEAAEAVPESSYVRHDLGVTLMESLRFSEASAELERATLLDPTFGAARSSLASSFMAQGLVDQAREHFLASLAISPEAGTRFRLNLMLPCILPSLEAIDPIRENYQRGIEELANANLRLKDPAREVGSTYFYLSYHGKCNRDPLQSLAQLYLKVSPPLAFRAEHLDRPRNPGPIRVGFISKYLRRHSIGRTTSGLIEQLDRRDFRTIALFVPPFVDDPLSQFIREKADEAVMLPGKLEEARNQVAELKLDVLFYQDIGMEPLTYFMGFSRLAPVQCLSFGHPDTTGIPSMDYFVSNDLFEPEAAETHYSEELFLLKGLGTLAYYYRPQTDTPKTRSDMRLPEGKTIYICPQTLFKLHPSYDLILGEILQRDPRGVLVLMQGKIASWRAQVEARLRKAIPQLAERLIFLPEMTTQDFLNAIALSDVMLDTPHFNGMNTSLEAFSVGMPIVTLPTGLHRGRHTQGMYRKMEFTECIATTEQQYVEIANRLGTQPDYRAHVRSEILSRNAVLYQDARVVREFERFFREALRRSGWWSGG